MIGKSLNEIRCDRAGVTGHSNKRGTYQTAISGVATPAGSQTLTEASVHLLQAFGSFIVTRSVSSGAFACAKPVLAWSCHHRQSCQIPFAVRFRV